MPTAATITGGSASSFIAGPVVKTMASGSTFSYPLGSVTTSKYRPAILGNTTAADTWTVEYVGNNPTNQGFSNKSLASPLKKVSMFEYWNISRVGATASDVTLTYGTGSYIPPDLGDAAHLANLKVVHWNSGTSQWEIAPGGGTVTQSGTNTAGTVKTTNQTSFSPDGIGSLDADSSLPVEWLLFSGNRIENTVQLNWSTASERNNDHFEIERSIDGRSFEKIGTHIGAGNSSAIQNYKFIDSEVLKTTTYYYRIKQVDKDGQFEFSDVVVIPATGKALQRWAALPNPTNDRTHFHIAQIDESIDSASTVEVQIISSNGVVVYEGDGSLDQVNRKLDVVMQNLGIGIYVVQISNGKYRESYRIAKM